VKIYPYIFIAGQFYQNYLESKDGLIPSKIIPEETSVDDVW